MHRMGEGVPESAGQACEVPTLAGRNCPGWDGSKAVARRPVEMQAAAYWGVAPRPLKVPKD
jgi:hypothetical protein